MVQYEQPVAIHCLLEGRENQIVFNNQLIFELELKHHESVYYTWSTVNPFILISMSSFFIVLCWFPYFLGSSWLAGGNSCRKVYMRLMITGLTPASISRANSSSVLHADLSSAIHHAPMVWGT
ncbi:unnamed protein product [Linum tenue]|uniref:Uncharacterized protein n=1 Tax=Linum tenue TaxID=586396 RepID=A0AAV0P5I2_9ROSI|nr:unnamed protein product [Linum tenue]